MKTGAWSDGAVSQSQANGTGLWLDGANGSELGGPNWSMESRKQVVDSIQEQDGLAPPEDLSKELGKHRVQEQVLLKPGKQSGTSPNIGIQELRDQGPGESGGHCLFK